MRKLFLNEEKIRRRKYPFVCHKTILTKSPLIENHKHKRYTDECIMKLIKEPATKDGLRETFQPYGLVEIRKYKKVAADIFNT